MRRAARPLLFLGTAAVVFGFAKLHARYVGDYDFSASSRFAWTIAFVGLLAVTAFGLGLPELPRSRRDAIVSSAGAPAIAGGVISVLQLLGGDAVLPRFVVLGSAVALVPWNVCCAAIARGGHHRTARRDRVLLVATHAEAVSLRDELDAEPERPAVLVHAMTPGEAAWPGDGSKPLCEWVLATRACLVVLDREALAEPTIVSQAASLHEAGLRVRTLSQFYETWLGKLPVSELERASLLFDIREVHGARYLRVKRMLDSLIAAAGVLVLVLALPLVTLGNRLGNRGRLFFRQERVGKNGRVFTLLKFRTMRDCDSPAEWTTEHDPRVTTFGRWLRRTHVDELPQILNILRGDLSLVGPRPEQVPYVAELGEKLPFYDMRHMVRPGLTGWAQVKYGYAGDERDALEKLQYEFWYLRNQSLTLDARVLGRTIRSVLRRAGR